MILNKIEDPRSTLDKARRKELFRFAQANGVSEITDETPAILARAILRQKGLTRITDIPERKLGAMNQPGTGMKYQNRMQTPAGNQQPQGVEADMVADLKRQFDQQQKRQVSQDAWRTELAAMSILDLGKELQRLNIHRDRKDNKDSMRAKITAHREANG